MNKVTISSSIKNPRLQKIVIEKIKYFYPFVKDYKWTQNNLEIYTDKEDPMI